MNTLTLSISLQLLLYLCSVQAQFFSSLHTVKAAKQVIEFSINRMFAHEKFCTIIGHKLEPDQLEVLASANSSVYSTFYACDLDIDLCNWHVLPRQTYQCAFFVTSSSLNSESQYLLMEFYPLANLIILQPQDPRAMSGFRAISLFRSPRSRSIVLMELCRGKVANIWNPDANKFLIPLHEPFGVCSLPPYLVMGRKFQVSLFGVVPYLFRGASGNIEGIDVELFKILAKKLLFMPSFKVEPEWGRYINGSGWTGTVGSVIRHESPIGIGDIGLTDERKGLLDHTTFLYHLTIAFYTQKPKPKDSFLKILRPMDWWCWIGFFTSAFAIGFFSIVALVCLKIPGKYGALDVFLIFLDCFLTLFHGLTFSSGSWFNKILKTWSGAILLAVWVLIVLAFNLFYDATLRPILLLVDYEKPIATMAEMLEKIDQPIVMSQGSSFIDSMQISTNPSARAIYKKVSANKWWFRGNVDQSIVDKIRNDGGAVSSLVTSYQYYTKSVWPIYRSEPMRMVDETVMTFPSAFIVSRRYYHLKRVMEPILDWCIDAGIVNKFSRDYLPPKEIKASTDTEKLDVWHFLSTFLFCGCLMFISLLTFMIEVCNKQISRFLNS